MKIIDKIGICLQILVILESRKKVVCISNIKDIRDKVKRGKSSEINNIDINTISTFADVKIDKDLPIQNRFIKFIQEVKNPYIFQSGDITVKMEYANGELNLQKCLESIIKNKVSG